MNNHNWMYLKEKIVFERECLFIHNLHLSQNNAWSCDFCAHSYYIN